MPARHEARQLGPDHLHIERERVADPGRDDLLRRHQDGADCACARPRRGGAGTGITVNSVLPGPTKSRGVVDFVGSLMQGGDKSFEEFETEFFEKVRPTSLIKRFATPEEVASLVTYIVSPLASATTGAALRVDGGVVKSAF